MIEAFKQKKYLQFLLLLVGFFLLCIIITPSEGNWLWRLPPLFEQLPKIINDGVSYLLFDWWLVDVWDPDIEEFEQQPLLKVITRSTSGVILAMIEFVREIMLGGVKTIVRFTSWDWATKNQWAQWPALPWTVIAGGATILAYSLKGRNLALFVGGAFAVGTVYGDPVICNDCCPGVRNSWIGHGRLGI